MGGGGGGGGFLPLMDENQNPHFDSEEKAVLLQAIFFGGKHLNECVFDDDFKEQVKQEIEGLKDKTDERAERYLNYDISIEETEAVILLLKKNKAPGPDAVYADLINNAGSEMIKALHSLFQKSWDNTKVSDGWIEAEVKFLRKHGKKNYHESGSYCPISLTSVLCKCTERILNQRLYGSAEHFNLLDREQGGFRHFRGTTDALLCLTQDIFNGFNEKEHTAALFIDLEKAYDSVWRNGLMVKLGRLGISGRMWKWIQSFLTDRYMYAFITLQGQRGQTFSSSIGLPQGAVISPLLFNLYVHDIFEHVSSKKSKFADDVTIWKTGKDASALDSLQDDFKEILKRGNQWRMKISIKKTEFCVFSLDNRISESAREVGFAIESKKVEYNKYPKILGVTLDEKLKFDRHIEVVEQKVCKSLDLIRKVEETEGIKQKCLLQLYKALIAPQLEYAASVWQVGNHSSPDRIQRKGLAICFGLPNSAGVEALEFMLPAPTNSKRRTVS